MTRQIVAYLSHSYRPEDRLLNITVWRELNARGVVFAVDPPSDRAKPKDRRPMDVTFIERMLQRADCFIAIVPDRKRSSRGKEPAWSPYQALEYRLAVRANKPLLIVADEDIDPGPLKPRHIERNLAYCDRRAREVLLDDNFAKTTDRLLREAESRHRDKRPMPPIGILRTERERPAWTALASALRSRLDELLEDVPANLPDDALLERAREKFVVIADLNPNITPPVLIGLLQGAAVPLFRTYLLPPTSDRASVERALRLNLDGSRLGASEPGDDAALAQLLVNYRIDEPMQPVHFWSETAAAEAAADIASRTEAYRDRERALETAEDASVYFRSLGGNRVFISTPAELASHSVAIHQCLEDAGFSSFHYKEAKDEMRQSEGWKPQLREQIDNSDLALVLFSDSYWTSEPCMDEFEQAIARWERHQLLLQIYVSTSTDELPDFLGMYQVAELGEPASADVVVDKVSARFSKGDQLGITDEQRGQLEALILRHCDVVDATELLRDVCRLAADAATPLEASLASCKTKSERASHLLRALVERVALDFSGAALGRLIYHLRRRERDPRKRGWLAALPTEWRLFPGLHDVSNWKRRKERKITDVVLHAEALESYSIISLLSGDHRQWLGAVQVTGAALARALEAQSISGIVQQPDCRVRVMMDVSKLMVPIEWTSLQESQPLSRTRPCYRQMTGLLGTTMRPSIEEQLDRGAAGPPRVLVFGYGSDDLRGVDQEVEDVYAYFVANYAARGWPEELITKCPRTKATHAKFGELLAHSDYDLVHLAGHAGAVGDEPALAVHPQDGADWLRAEELRHLLSSSSARFVYLSCCSGAAGSLKSKPGLTAQATLCRAVLEAGVPEVLAYLWPVGDETSRRFALRFYDAFVDAFDAPLALYRARSTCQLDDPLWAAAVLVKQPRVQ